MELDWIISVANILVVLTIAMQEEFKGFSYSADFA